MTKKKILIPGIFILLVFITGCIVPYEGIPAEPDRVLVVDGCITDECSANIIRLYKSRPVTSLSSIAPLKKCMVWLTDDQGNSHNLTEFMDGQYSTDPESFRGVPGRKYVLHINTGPQEGNVNYESLPVEMKPAPAIDSIYYARKYFRENNITFEGCEILLDTYDETGDCKYLRWGFEETWEFHLPFNVPEKICWKSEKEDRLMIANTSRIKNGIISRYPVKTITNPVDRLLVKYSILVKQYSLNEDEYLYWNRVAKLASESGGLYDLVPSVIPNNLYCADDPSQKVLGYFSVSAVTSRRLFITDDFKNTNTQYFGCLDTIYDNNFPAEIYWIVEYVDDEIPPYTVISYDNDCIDCRKNGTNIRPDFWDDDKITKSK